MKTKSHRYKKTKQNKTKQKQKQNKTKQNKTKTKQKQNKNFNLVKTRYFNTGGSGSTPNDPYKEIEDKKDKIKTRLNDYFFKNGIIFYRFVENFMQSPYKKGSNDSLI
jgi:hypothetical protein